MSKVKVKEVEGMENAEAILDYKDGKLTFNKRTSAKDEDGNWLVHKETGKRVLVESDRIIVSNCPTKSDMLHWAVDAEILTLSDLAVAGRAKNGVTGEMTWEAFKQAMTAEVKRVDAQTLAMARAIQTGDISALSPEQCAQLAAALAKK